MNQLTIILFVIILLGAPLLVGYGLRRFNHWRNPQNIIRPSAVYIRLGGNVLCLLGCTVAILSLKMQWLSHAASLLLGAVFFWPGLLIFAYMGVSKPARTSADVEPIDAGAAAVASAVSHEVKSAL